MSLARSRSAIRQHVVLVEAAARYQAAQESTVAAYRDMIRSGEDIKKLLPAEFHALGRDVDPGHREDVSYRAIKGRRRTPWPYRQKHPDGARGLMCIN